MGAPSLRNVTMFVCVVLALCSLSWLTVSFGVPKVYAPFNSLVFLPLVLGAGYFALAVVPLFFCLWCWPILRGDRIVPIRSIVLLICTVALSALALLVSAHDGFHYCGTAYVAIATTINVLCWACLGLLAILARRRPSFHLNIAFHAALFAWLAYYAFPYFGELP